MTPFALLLIPLALVFCALSVLIPYWSKHPPVLEIEELEELEE